MSESSPTPKPPPSAATAPLGPKTSANEAEALSRGEARRKAFIAAAEEVFLEQGFETASVNEVVRRSGGSLATLYAQFGSKEGLFLAVVESMMARFTEAMTSAFDPQAPLEEGLETIGLHFLTSVLRPRGLDFYRIVLGESRKYPELWGRFLQFGPERVRALVAAYLLARRVSDDLAITESDAERAGGFFCDMVRGRYHSRAFCTAEAFSEDELREHVRCAVRLIVYGLRRRA